MARDFQGIATLLAELGRKSERVERRCTTNEPLECHDPPRCPPLPRPHRLRLADESLRILRYGTAWPYSI